MTKYEFEARQLIGTWLAKEKIKPIGTLRHVHPRCYVVGKAAKSGLIVARPWKDSEEHMKVHTKKFPLVVIRTFDTDLDAGDWCATAYVCHDGVQETVAVGHARERIDMAESTKRGSCPVVLHGYKFERIDEFEARIEAPNGEAWCIRHADANDGFARFVWEMALAATATVEYTDIDAV